MYHTELFNFLFRESNFFYPKKDRHLNHRPPLAENVRNIFFFVDKVKRYTPKEKT